MQLRQASRRGLARITTLALGAGLLAAGGVALPASSANASAAAPVDGALTSGDSLFPNQGNGGYDALHYDIKLLVDVAVSSTNNALSTTSFRPGTQTTVRAATTGEPLSSFALDFQGSTGTLEASTLNVDSVTVNGTPAEFTRIENTTQNNATTDVHKVVITPTSPVDGEFTTVVNYSGLPVRHTDTDGSFEGWNNTTDGATFLNEPVGAMTAYPHNNTPSDKATYTISIEAPTKLTTSATAASANPGLRDAAAVSNGELVSRTANSDGTRTTWVWDQRKPMASDLAMISIGRYDMYESDIVLASGRTLHEWSFIDPAISVANQTTTQATRAQFKSILDFLESRYGPYPGNSTGLLTDVVPSGINYALETQDRSFFPNSAGRSTTIHELMHQWWGNAVAPVDWNDIWLNEGPATYAEAQVAYESSGTSTVPTETTYFNAWNSSNPSSNIWTVPTAAMTQASQLFGQHVYTRGAWTLEALRTAIGVPAFNEVMLQWQQRYTGTSKRTSDFIALAEEISGRSLTAFFQAWLYGNTKAPWPVKFNLTLSGPTSRVDPGDAVEYLLTSRNTGKVTQAGSVATLDLSDVLDDVTLGTLPANTTLDGTTLTWTIPTTAVNATSTITIPGTVRADTGFASLRAVARASTLGATCIECDSSVFVGLTPVSPTAVPVITGTAAVGAPLSAVTDGWAPNTTFSYQWLADNTPIVGATSATYTPSGFTVGLTLRVKVTGLVGGSTSPASRTSDPTAAVVRAALGNSTPTIVGTPQGGSPLTVVPGAWDPGTYFTYQWLANGVAITAATGPVYTPASNAQIGQQLSVRITGTKFGYNNQLATSITTAAVTIGEQTLTPIPEIPGSPQALSPVRGVTGTWDPGTSLTYQWFSDSTPIPGATAVTFTPTVAQVGTSLTFAVTSTKPAVTTVTRTSEASAPVRAPAQTLNPTPLVSGTAKVGETLTLEPGTWDTGTTLTYQWFADDEAIAGATDLTLDLAPDTVGTRVTATVTSVKDGFETASRTSEPTGEVAPGDLSATPTPTVTGTPQVGLPLTGVPGTWDDGTTLAYRWLADGNPVGGATGLTFVPGADEVGAVMAFEVTGTKAGYSEVTTVSDATEAVALGELTSTPVPTVTGTPTVDSPFTAAVGVWDDGATLAYAWSIGGTPIDGATSPSYTPTAAQVGSPLTFSVTGSRAGYETVTKSVTTAAVQPGEFSSSPAPVITGRPQVDRVLNASPGEWEVDTTFAYQWFVDGIPVTGADAGTFTPSAGNVGKIVTLRVTGTKAGRNSVSRTSEPSAPVALGDLAATPTPLIAGVAKVDQTLEAQPGRWDEGVAFGYQWFANGASIPGATRSTFAPGPDLVGSTVTVAVTGSKAGYAGMTRTSAPSAGVLPGDLDKTPKPSVAGANRVGAILTALPGAWDDQTTLSYQWLRDGVPIAGAIGTTYRLAPEDRPRVSVQITGDRPGYVSVSRTSEEIVVQRGRQTQSLSPKIKGKARVGKTLRAVAGPRDVGATLVFRWRVGGKPVKGAGSKLVLRKAFEGERIRVKVKARKLGYEPVVALSRRVGPVR